MSSYSLIVVCYHNYELPIRKLIQVLILPIQKIHGCRGHLSEKKDLAQLLGLEMLLIGLEAEML